MSGLGPVDLISRFDQNKTEKASDAKASAASVLSSASKPSSISSSNSSKRAARSSDVSKQNAKDFSTVLGEASDAPKSAPISELKVESKLSKEDSKQEELAGAAGVASQSQRQPVRAPISDDKGVVETPVVERASGASVQQLDAKVPAEAATEGSIEERVGAIIESLEETADTELSMRHLSMRDFLSKMKEEFGIDPNAIVKAFAQLDQSALMAPPEQTAEAVLSQLNLKPEQMPKAERFYREMLNQTGESALNETLAGVGAGITLNVLSEQDVALTKLQQSISGLNDAFARREGPAANQDAAMPTTAASLAAALQAAAVTEAGVSAPVTEAAASAAPVTPLTLVTADAASVESTGPDGESKDKAEKAGESKFASLGAALSAATAGLAGASTGGGSGTGSNGSDSKSKSDTSKPREFASIEAALASNGFAVPPAGEKSAVPLAAGTSTSAALAATLAGSQNSEGGSATNAQELVRHAQILMKNGGGEMKMQLKPEGVGEVTLKVAVKDGQVAIQMMTESDSAKKLLESNLDDLKTSLAQHKLHVDALKIEVGGEMAKQRFEQSQQDANREQARQFAQDFMGQFRDDRQGFRQGFAGSSGFKNYQEPKRNATPELEPVVAASVSNNKSSGDRRLNLVA